MFCYVQPRIATTTQHNTRRSRSQHRPTHKWINLTHTEHEHRPGERPRSATRGVAVSLSCFATCSHVLQLLRTTQHNTRRYRSQHRPTHKWINLTHTEHEHRPGERPRSATRGVAVEFFFGLYHMTTSTAVISVSLRGNSLSDEL